MCVLNLEAWGYFRSRLPGHPACKPRHMAVTYLSVLIVDVALLVMGYGRVGFVQHALGVSIEKRVYSIFQ